MLITLVLWISSLIVKLIKFMLFFLFVAVDEYIHRFWEIFNTKIWHCILFAGEMLRLRCKTKNGSHIMQGLTHQSCVQELKSKVEELTGIPCNVQKIMVGYPPSSLDLRNLDAHLKDYPIKSGMFHAGKIYGWHAVIKSNILMLLKY